jgi:FAD:protein FMN transferase
LVGSTISAIGTTATLVVSDPRHLHQGVEILESEIDAIDRACSRFRADSEIARVNSAGGGTVPVTGLLLEAIEVALRAAAVTGGVVDPTVGEAMRIIGYDRDFSAMASVGPPGGI